MTKIKVLIIEENRLLREGITALLNIQLDISTLPFDENDNIMEIAKKLKPHVILLDLGLQSQDSLQLTEFIKRELPKTEIIVMDLIPTQPEVAEFVQAGVAGFILKDAKVEDFLSTIRTVAKGEKVLPASLTETVFSHIVEFALKSGKADQLMKSVKLTRRENEIVNLIAEGMSNKEISSELNIAVHTVKSHVHNTLDKLALHTRLEIANFAHTEGTEKTLQSQDTKNSQ